MSKKEKFKKGDKVKVMRGQFKKHVGKVERIDLKKSNIFIEGIEISKKDSSLSLLKLRFSTDTITGFSTSLTRMASVIPHEIYM